MLSTEDAFKAGLKLVRDAGIEVRANEVPVLAAYRVFMKRIKGLEHDPRFEAEGPKFARRVILEALVAKAKADGGKS